MEVDEATRLKLRNLGVRESDAQALIVGEPYQSTSDADDGAPPQFGCVSVPHDFCVVVKAIGAQRPAQARVRVHVPLATRHPSAVRAGADATPRSAPSDLAAAGPGPAMHRTERRGRERGEDGRVNRDGLGDALAADQSGADELVGVTPVGLRAGWADRGARRSPHAV